MSEQVQSGTAGAAAAGGLVSAAAMGLTRKLRPDEAIIQGFLFFCGFVSIFTTLGIVYVLIADSIRFFFAPEVNFLEFISPVWITETGIQLAHWQPKVNQFGIWSLINATLMVSVIALVVAIPLGLGAAIYLSEYADRRVRNVLKPTLEILAGIPTVVYGYFALTFMTPLLKSIFGDTVVQIYNTASAGIFVGILLLPLIASMSEDALRAVPLSLRQASYGMGATKFETAVGVVLPGAFSGVVAALILAMSRALGETMIVALAAGSGSNFTLNPFEAAETMTGHIARITGGTISYGTLEYQSVFAIGLTLFLLTLGLNMLSRKLVQRFREVYE